MKNTAKLVSLLLALALLLTVSVGSAELAEADRVEGTPGCAYALSEDGTYYIWCGITDAFDMETKDLVIGNWYDGKPVKEICGSLDMEGHGGVSLKDVPLETLVVSKGITTLNFGSLICSSLKKVVLPDGIENYPQALMLFESQLEEFVIGKGLKAMDVDILMRNEGNLQTIYFRGTEEEWNAIEIAEKGNDDILECENIVFNYAE